MGGNEFRGHGARARRVGCRRTGVANPRAACDCVLAPLGGGCVECEQPVSATTKSSLRNMPLAYCFELATARSEMRAATPRHEVLSGAPEKVTSSAFQVTSTLAGARKQRNRENVARGWCQVACHSETPSPSSKLCRSWPLARSCATIAAPTSDQVVPVRSAKRLAACLASSSHKACTSAGEPERNAAGAKREGGPSPPWIWTSVYASSSTFSSRAERSSESANLKGAGLTPLGRLPMTVDVYSPIHEYEVLIIERHLDTFGHVNNATYLDLFEAARWDWITGNGFGLERIRELGQGPTVLEVVLRFKREIKNRQRITIRTWICESCRRARSAPSCKKCATTRASSAARAAFCVVSST